MVQQSLIDYVKRMLQQGYDASLIRSTLINSGYSSYDVDEALRGAGVSAAKRINTKLLAVVFAVLLVLAAGTLLVLKLLQPEPAVLSLSVSLFSSEVAPGGSVIANIDVLNPSGSRTSGLVDVVVDGPSGVVVSSTESFTVVDRASVPVYLLLPAGISEGSYELSVVASYKGRSVRASALFDVVSRVVVPSAPGEVLSKPAEEQARELQASCPGRCDDLNFCTSDSCVSGECVYAPISPCCGNNVCESGESESSCALDCAVRRESSDDVIARAVSSASDVSAAIGICDSLSQRALIDSCLNQVSAASESKVPCAVIVDGDLRDACLIPFAYKNDFSVCAEISNPYMKNSCTSLAELSKYAPEQ